jgi:hypothetical protein
MGSAFFRLQRQLTGVASWFVRCVIHMPAIVASDD